MSVPDADQPAGGIRPFPRLDKLHERHFGLTPSICGALAEAAAVCLNRHHRPPIRAAVTGADVPDAEYRLDWPIPTPREQGASANTIDATEAGAYCLALGAAEMHLNLLAVCRAEVETGADYYIGPPGAVLDTETGELDLEQAFRLEVSGMDHYDLESDFARRLAAKVDQARRGRSNVPAVASVVAFRPCHIGFRVV